MPSLTIAALINADTWLGASAWARGSHGCSGTAPAFEANPNRHNTNTVPLTAGDSAAELARMAGKSVPTAAASQARPNSRVTNPAWVIVAYQTVAGRTGPLWRC